MNTRAKQRKAGGPQILVNILLFNEGDAWIAQCLDWDIAGQSDSPRKALQAFEAVFWNRVARDIEKGRPLLETIDPAPDDLWQQFQTGMPFRDAYPLHPPAKIRIRVEAGEIRLAA